MKKSVGIIASLCLISSLSAGFVTTANSEEPVKKPVATEIQTNRVSRDYMRASLEDIVDTKRAMQEAMRERREKEQLAAEQKKAEQAAAHEAERKKQVAMALQKRRERLEKQSKPRPRLKYSTPSGNIRDYARGLVGSGQFGCLDAIFNRESGWNPTATNPSSGAYGIPQALPGSKMASAGSDWRTNPYTQVRWGVSYIKSRYGTPCNAWAHSQKMGWY